MSEEPTLDAGLEARLWKAANSYATERGGCLPGDTIFAEAAYQIARLEADLRQAKRKAVPIALGAGERRNAAKKLLCDICACSAEAEPASLDLPHVVKDCIEPLETLICERDACLYLSQEAHKYAGRDGHDIFDAIAEKAAAVAMLKRLWDAVAAYGAIGHEGSHLLEVMSEARAMWERATPLTGAANVG